MIPVNPFASDTLINDTLIGMAGDTEIVIWKFPLEDWHQIEADTVSAPLIWDTVTGRIYRNPCEVK